MKRVHLKSDSLSHVTCQLMGLHTTPSYKTYACKYLHLCPTLLTKFNSTHVKNLQYSICIIADVVGSWATPTLSKTPCRG